MESMRLLHKVRALSTQQKATPTKSNLSSSKEDSSKDGDLPLATRKMPGQQTLPLKKYRPEEKEMATTRGSKRGSMVIQWQQHVHLKHVHLKRSARPIPPAPMTIVAGG